MPIQFELQKFVNPVFVETGTFKGAGIRRALKAGFPKIVSIEVDRELVERARREFHTHVESGDVRLVLGDSGKRLAGVIGDFGTQITFWLDAHRHRGKSGAKPCPLYEELDAIARHPIKTHTILIDDRRIIVGRRGWGKRIEEEKIIRKIREIDSAYEISYDHGHVPGDVLVARVP